MFTNPIKYIPLGLTEEKRLEKIHTVVFQKALDGSASVAKEIAELIHQKTLAHKPCVLA